MDHHVTGPMLVTRLAKPVSGVCWILYGLAGPRRSGWLAPSRKPWARRRCRRPWRLLSSMLQACVLHLPRASAEVREAAEPVGLRGRRARLPLVKLAWATGQFEANVAHGGARQSEQRGPGCDARHDLDTVRRRVETKVNICRGIRYLSGVHTGIDSQTLTRLLTPAGRAARVRTRSRGFVEPRGSHRNMGTQLIKKPALGRFFSRAADSHFTGVPTGIDSQTLTRLLTPAGRAARVRTPLARVRRTEGFSPQHGNTTHKKTGPWPVFL